MRTKMSCNDDGAATPLHWGTTLNPITSSPLVCWLVVALTPLILTNLPAHPPLPLLLSSPHHKDSRRVGRGIGKGARVFLLGVTVPFLV